PSLPREKPENSLILRESGRAARGVGCGHALDPRPIDIVADSSGRWHAVYDAIRCGSSDASQEFCSQHLCLIDRVLPRSRLLLGLQGVGRPHPSAAWRRLLILFTPRASVIANAPCPTPPRPRRQ